VTVWSHFLQVETQLLVNPVASLYDPLHCCGMVGLSGPSQFVPESIMQTVRGA
jgi:hypothetical protein